MAQLNVTELDFEDIKSNLRTFFESQSEFSDYDFEGSALSILIDSLAYNTHYNAILAHMLANESFLDTAIKRSSVVSLAKAIGYTPKSRKAAQATLNLSIIPGTSYTNSVFTLSRDSAFTAGKDGTTYTFYPSEDVSATLQDVAGTNTFVFNDLIVKEGTRVSNSFTLSADKLQGPFIIPNKNIDTTTLRVRVQKSGSDLAIETYNKASNFVDLNSTSKVYFVEEGHDGLYQIVFGDGVIGAGLDAGNVVVIDYLVTNGESANGCKTFTNSQTLTAVGELVSNTVSSVAGGGAKKESIDEIKRNAPQYNVTKNRAVTAKDYSALIQQVNPNIQSVSVWGGEDNDPPMYGKVFISLNPAPGSIITQSDKDLITAEVIDVKTPIAIQPEYVDPEFTYIGLKVTATYDNKATTLTAGQLNNAINSAITEFFTTDLNYLNKSFYYSVLHDLIKGVSDSITSVNIVTRLQKRLTPTLNTDANYSFAFNNKLEPRYFHSTWFTAKIATTNYKVRLVDVPSSTVVAPVYSGTGTLKLETEDGIRIADVGTVDYDTGKVTISEMHVVSLFGDETQIRVTSSPHEDVKDILTNVLRRTSDTTASAVVAKPSQNTILSLDDTVYNLTTGARLGLTIDSVIKQKEV
jgi:hypothetical protein